MASIKGLGLPRRMLLVMCVFTSLLVQYAQGGEPYLDSPCQMGKEADANLNTGCNNSKSKLNKCEADSTAVAPANGKCKCDVGSTWKPNDSECAKDPTKPMTPSASGGSGSGESAKSSAVRTFIPSIFALAGLFLGVGFLSTF